MSGLGRSCSRPMNKDQSVFTSQMLKVTRGERQPDPGIRGEGNLYLDTCTDKKQKDDCDILQLTKDAPVLTVEVRTIKQQNMIISLEIIII